MIMDGDRQALLGELLADDVLIQEFLDLPRRGDRAERRRARRRHLPLFLADDVVGEVDAVGADVDVGGSFDHGADVTGGFAAKAASGHASSSKTAGGVIPAVRTLRMRTA